MIIEDVAVEVETSRGRAGNTSEVLVFAVRPKAAAASRCSRCQRRCPGYDSGDTTRRWRTLDVRTSKAYLQASAPRVQCREHGVVVAHVPWARPGAKHTHLFEDTCAWLAAHAAMSVLTVLLRGRSTRSEAPLPHDITPTSHTQNAKSHCHSNNGQTMHATTSDTY